MFKYNVALIMILLGFHGFIPAADTINTESDSSGKQKVLGFLKTQTGQSSFTPAQTVNLSLDLNIPAIADFFDCTTEVGRWYLQESLNNPLKANSELIVKRKQALELLVNDKDLKAQVERVIKESKEHEKNAMILLSDYFKGSTCPELKKLDEYKKTSRLKHAYMSFMAKNPLSTSLSSLWYGLLLLGGPAVIGTTLYMNFASIAALTIGADPLIQIGQGIIMTGISAYKTHVDYSGASEKRKKIHALNRLIKLAEELEKVAQTKGLTLQHPLSKSTNKEGKDLMNSIRSSRYAYESSYVFAVPLVHSFLYKLYEKEQHLAALFAAIAEMDAYNAIATKIIESQSTATKPLCFAQYLNDVLPTIKAEGVWYTVVKNPVLNDFNETNNIILTGPNAGGKSTFIRAILQNIVLAQTYGIAAAQKFACTPFDTIHTYLNIQDDPVRKKSKYLIELEVAGNIIKTAKNMPAGEKYFWTTDELFSGTGEQDGGRVAYKFIEDLSSNKNYNTMMFIFATHFQKLTELENANPKGRYKNYKVNPPIRTDAGDFAYPYTITPGINTSGIAYDLAVKEGLFKQ